MKRVTIAILLTVLACKSGANDCPPPAVVDAAPSPSAKAETPPPLVDAAVAVDDERNHADASLPEGFAEVSHAIALDIVDTWVGAVKRTYTIHLKRKGTIFTSDASTQFETSASGVVGHDIPSVVIDRFLASVAAHGKDMAETPVPVWDTTAEYASIEVKVITASAPLGLVLRVKTATRQWSVDGIALAHDADAKMKNVHPSINAAYDALIEATEAPKLARTQVADRAAIGNAAPCKAPYFELMDGTKLPKWYCVQPSVTP